MNSVIGDIVAQNYKTSEVFKAYDVDFCCKGNRTLLDLSESGQVDLEKLIAELKNIHSEAIDPAIEFNAWPLDLLADYIEKKYHRYVEQKIPIIMEYLTKVCHVHGQNNSELQLIKEIFCASSEDLKYHMMKEEKILFPYIRKMLENERKGFLYEPPMFGSVNNPIKMMMDEHTTEGNRYREIALLSNNYQPPSAACNSYIMSYAMLKEFEEKLHEHIHLENNILFPGAIKYENNLMHYLN